MATDGDPDVEGVDAAPPVPSAPRKRRYWPTALLLALAAVLVFLFLKWISPESTASDSAPAEKSDTGDQSSSDASGAAAPAAQASDLTAPGPVTSSSVPPTADTGGGGDQNAQDSSALIGGYTPAPH